MPRPTVKNDVPDLLAMKQASLARMVATAKVLHEQRALQPVSLPPGTPLPTAVPLRVRTRR
jgi:hypothetical protein